jgi:hypothetical protein
MECRNVECNCNNCIWNRIVSNSGSLTIYTKRGLALKFEVINEVVNWIPLELTLSNPYSQSKTEILKCLEPRSNSLKTSSYPGTAQSYKWALLNSNSIWV